MTSNNIKDLQLTPQQIGCVNSPSEHLLVRGVAGSGKTLVLLRRAMRLASEGESVRFITYANSLADYGLQLLELAHETRVAVGTYHSWAFRQYKNWCIRNRREPLKCANSVEREASIAEALAEVKASLYADGASSESRIFQRPQEFWKAEFDWMKGQELRATDGDVPRYLELERRGRGSALNRDLRGLVWRAFTVYNQRLRARKRIEYVSLPLILQREDVRDFVERTDHILIDEAQDLTLADLRLLIRSARKSITIAADEGQRIYHPGFAWRDLGVNLTGGGRSRHLAQSYRSTSQIAAFVNPIRAKLDDLQGEEVINPAGEGPKPVLYGCGSLAGERQLLLSLVRELRSKYPQATIGILGKTHELLNAAEHTLAKSGIRGAHMSGGRADGRASLFQPGVIYCTFHSAKGLEFDHVIALHIEDGSIPADALPGVDPEDVQVEQQKDRRLLYVALSRPRLSLHVLYAATVSPFIDDVPRSAYEHATLSASEVAS